MEDNLKKDFIAPAMDIMPFGADPLSNSTNGSKNDEQWGAIIPGPGWYPVYD